MDKTELLKRGRGMKKHRVRLGKLAALWSWDRMGGQWSIGDRVRFVSPHLGRTRFHCIVWWGEEIMFERQPGLLLPRFPMLPWLDRLIDAVYYFCKRRKG